MPTPEKLKRCSSGLTSGLGPLVRVQDCSRQEGEEKREQGGRSGRQDPSVADGRESAEISPRITRSAKHPRALATVAPTLQQWMAMSENDDPPPASAASKDAARPQKAQKRSLFEIPPALKRIFDKFPLVTYGENELPLRAPRRRRDEHVLYVFAKEEDARKGRPSFNPACLRWQTYLKLSGISHRTVASTNHASPSGALPFLLPATKDEAAALPVSSNRLKSWIAAQHKTEKKEVAPETDDVRYEAYQTLLESRIRVAWLYQLYLNPANSPLLHRLYISPCSSNPVVQMTIAHQLRQAAEMEVVKASGSSTVVETDIMRAAEEALAALSTLLGEHEWFFGQAKPGLFDASVFAYTHLLLDEEMAWAENQLGDALKRYENLVQHRGRIVEMYY